jgi:hypothetical protein
MSTDTRTCRAAFDAQPLPSFAPISTKVAPPQPGQLTDSPIEVKEQLSGFWRFWPRRNVVKQLLDQALRREQPVSSYPLEYTPGQPARIVRPWNPSMGGNSGLLARGYLQTWDSLPLPPRIVPLIMQGGKPSAIMGVRTPQQLNFKNATNPQRIAPIYVGNV